MTEGVRLYVGTEGGLYVFRATGDGWQEVNQGVTSGLFWAMSGCKSQPERVFVATSRDGLYRTGDAGAQWKRVLDRDVRSVTVDPTDDRVVYAGTEPVRLFRSEDSGDTWHELDAIQTLPLAVRKEWWFPLPPHEGHALFVFVHPEDPRIIYVGLEHGGIIRSHDRGETWEDVSAGIDYLDIHHIESLPGDVDRYFVSSARGFYTSDDPADGWVRAENGCTRDYFHDFLFLPPKPGDPAPTLLCATADKSPGSWEEAGHAEAAVFRSRDGARSWERVGEGLPDLIEEAIWGFVKHPLEDDGAFFGLGKMYLRPGFENGPGSVMMTHDRGDNWTRLDLDLPAVRSLWAAPD